MRGTAVGCLALLCVLGAGCGDDDDGAPGGSGGAAANGGNASGNGSGSGGARAGSGGTGQSSGAGGSSAGASGGHAGAGARGGSGSGASGAGASGGTCDLKCPDGEHCELVQVTCIRAPCNPVPQCVPEGGQAGAGNGDQGDTCGTRGTGSCADGFYCKFPAGADCGRSDAGGTCQSKPTACTLDLNPVCGCDGETYGNPCAAASAGVSVESEGECEQASAVDCDHRKASCRMLPAPCPDGQVRAVQGICYGDCVNVDRCACSEAAACPEPDSYTCHMSAGHCGPFV